MSTARVEVADPFLTREEVADLLKVSTRTVDRYIDSGALLASKVGRLVRVRRADFDAFTAPAAPQLGVESAPTDPPVSGGASSLPAA